MRFTLALLGFVAVASAANSGPWRRQNDLPDCVEGEDGPGGTFDSGSQPPGLDREKYSD